MGILNSVLKSLKVTLLVGFALFYRAAFSQVDPPSGITATGQCAVIDLAWQPVSGASSYVIYRSYDPVFFFEPIGSTDGLNYRDGTSSNVTMIFSGTYYYKIASVGTSGEGAQSSAVAGTTISPTNWISAVPSGASNMVKWGGVSGSSLLYRYSEIRRGQIRLGTVIANFTSTPTSFLDRTAPRDVKSFYRLYTTAKGWETGPGSVWSKPDILSGPFDIDLNPTNGVLPDALILPGWMAQTMPTDSSNAPSGGPSSAISVDLAHGVASAGAPGVTALNPDGSDFGFSLQYRTALAAGNVASAGLPLGWTHNWDVRIIQDGTQTGWDRSFRLVYPSGASEVLTPDLDSNGNPLDTFTLPVGAPYVVTGVHSTGSNSTGKWDSITISGNGVAKQVFTQAVGDVFYRLVSQVDPNGASTLYFTYNNGKLTQINNGRSDNFAARITISYNNGGLISQAATSGQNFVNIFTRNYTVTSGNLTEASRLNLNTSEWTYSYGFTALNGQSFLTNVGSITPTGSTTSATIGYDPDSGRANIATDAIGNSRLYNYTVSEDGGNTTTAGARTTTIKDTVGNTFDASEVICDDQGRETVSKDRLGSATTITYGASNDPSAVTQVQPPLGSPSMAEYDSHGNLTKATAPYGNYIRYTWEYPTEAPLGRITKVQEFGRDQTPKAPTTYSYYVLGEQNYFNQPTNCGPIGYLKRVTFPNHGTLKYTYGGNGNLLTVSGIETYSYGYFVPGNSSQLIGRPTVVTDANGRATTFAYDSNLRLGSVTDPLGISVSADYNEYGQVKKTYLPGSKSIDIAYGVNGRAASSSTLNTPQGNTTLFTNTYNPESILATSKNSLNVTETQSPNPALGLSSVKNGNSQPMHLFTPDTNLRTVDYRIGNGSNAVGIKTTFNAMGNAISTKQTLPTIADIGTSNYRADDPDMLDSSLASNTSTFAANFNTSYTYDAFGRIWTATSVGTGTGANVGTTAPYSVMHTYTYDDEDHVLTDNNITYTYYASGLLKTMTVRDGLGNYVRYSYNYDSKQRISLILAERVNNSAGDIVLQSLASATYMYDNSDRVTYVWTTFGVTKYVYDSESRISAIYNLRSDGNAPQLYKIDVELPNGGGVTQRAVLSQFTSITYDKQNNRTGMLIALATTSGNPTVYKTGAAAFGYDDAGRLTSESWTGNIVGGTGVSYTHGYDNADNLTTLRSSGLTVDTASDLLTSLGYSFNSFGDCESWKNTGFDGTPWTLSASLGWDPAGQLTRVAGPSAITNSFNSNVTQQMAYDDQGRRVSSRVYGYQFQSSGPTFYTDSYTYSGSDLVMRQSLGTPFGSSTTVGNDFSQKDTVFYLIGPTGPVSEFDVDGNVADLTYDPQGNCVASNKGGSLSSSPWMLYDAYGKPVAKHPNMTFDDASRAILNQPLQYKGQFGYIADAHTGAYYCTHRFYDPNSGRWLSRDPIGLEGGTNTFTYCNGNPVMQADPSGLDSYIIISGISILDKEHDNSPANFTKAAYYFAKKLMSEHPGEKIHILLYSGPYANPKRNHGKKPNLKAVLADLGTVGDVVQISNAKDINPILGRTTATSVKAIAYFGHSAADAWLLNYASNPPDANGEFFGSDNMTASQLQKPPSLDKNAYFFSAGCSQGVDKGFCSVIASKWRIKAYGANNKTDFAKMISPYRPGVSHNGKYVTWMPGR